MKAVKISSFLVALACGCAFAPLSSLAASPYPSADVLPPGPPPALRELTPQEQDRLVRGLADGRPPIAGDVNRGATAMCSDNTVSRSHDPLETCEFHGGVDHWFRPGPLRNPETIAG